MLSAAAAACGQDAGAPGPVDATQTPAPAAPEPMAPPPEPAKINTNPATSSSASATPAASRKSCYLSVDGKVLLDEKLGMHIAFGRSEHFGGQVGPDAFTKPEAVIHIDRVYVPEMQPDVVVKVVDIALEEGRILPLMRDGEYVVDFA